MTIDKWIKKSLIDAVKFKEVTYCTLVHSLKSCEISKMFHVFGDVFLNALNLHFNHRLNRRCISEEFCRVCSEMHIWTKWAYLKLAPESLSLLLFHFSKTQNFLFSLPHSSIFSFHSRSSFESTFTCILSFSTPSN